MSLSGRPAAEEISTEEKVSFLRRPEAYGRPAGRVDVIETHMSWVFLAGQRVYKLKKPLRSDFTDLRSLESRRQNCLQSVRLNRRLAADIYLGILPVTRTSSGELALGAEGDVIDWLVEMRRLPADRMLDAAIANHCVGPEDIQRVSEQLDAFYERQKPVSMAAVEYVHRFLQDIEDTHAVLSRPEHGLPSQLLRHLTRAQQQFLDRSSDVLARRARDRHVVEAHGDLRPEHVCLIEPPAIIDCLEFNRALRLLDPLDELSYLALECERLGAPGIGTQLLRNYQRTLTRTPPDALLSFYSVFRACLRAKIAVWHLDDPSVQDRGRWIRRAREYLEIAARKAPNMLREV